MSKAGAAHREGASMGMPGGFGGGRGAALVPEHVCYWLLVSLKRWLPRSSGIAIVAPSDGVNYESGASGGGATLCWHATCFARQDRYSNCVCQSAAAPRTKRLRTSSSITKCGQAGPWFGTSLRCLHQASVPPGR